MYTIGTDILEIRRIHMAIERWGKRFLERIYTTDELAYCRERPPQLAARFAAKEAVMKALRTGRWGTSWKEIEVIRQHGGAPTVHLTGRTMSTSLRLGIIGFALSLSHSRDYALATVIAWHNEDSNY
jgi:holo-[acyl-carrier protein] synthase